MAQSRSRTEIMAVNVINDVITRSEYLLPGLNYGDKGISIDGFIQLFENKDVDRADSLLLQIPVQIKGRKDPTKNLKRVNDRTRKENVRVRDLEYYSRSGGAIFFYVFFDKEFDKHAVFYTVLLPVKCKNYIKIARGKNLKELPVSFDRMEESGSQLYQVCAQFYEEQKRQGLGDGTIMQHMVSWDDIRGETTLTVSAVGVKDEMDLLQRIVRGDVYLYKQDGSFSVPVEWIEGGVIVKCSKYEHPVMIGEEKYFDYLIVEKSTARKHPNLRFGESVIVDIDSSKFSFNKHKASIKELSNTAKFFLALEKEKAFSAGEFGLKLADFNINKESRADMEFFIAIDEILDSIGLDLSNKKFGDIDDKFMHELIVLYEIVNHAKDSMLAEEFTHFDWSIDGKKYPLVIVKRPIHEKNEIYSFLFCTRYQTFCSNDKGEHFPVPTFAFPEYESMKNLYQYDIEGFKEQVRRIEVNKDTSEYINIGALKLINVYDSSGDMDVLDMAGNLFESIQGLTAMESFIDINRLQVKKRKGGLGHFDKEELERLSKCGDERVEFGAYVLLDDKEMADSKYALINEVDKKELMGTPLMALYDKL